MKQRSRDGSTEGRSHSNFHLGHFVGVYYRFRATAPLLHNICPGFDVVQQVRSVGFEQPQSDFTSLSSQLVIDQRRSLYSQPKIFPQLPFALMKTTTPTLALLCSSLSLVATPWACPSAFTRNICVGLAPTLCFVYHVMVRCFAP